MQFHQLRFWGLFSFPNHSASPNKPNRKERKKKTIFPNSVDTGKGKKESTKPQ